MSLDVSARLRPAGRTETLTEAITPRTDETNETDRHEDPDGNQSRGAMRDLNHQLKALCQRNRDGSFATQADREQMLALFANQLHEMEYRHMRADSLKPKHIDALLERWKADGISTGTMKNRLSTLRWWAEKVGKENVVARENDAYGVERRQFVTNRDKGKPKSTGSARRTW